MIYIFPFVSTTTNNLKHFKFCSFPYDYLKKDVKADNIGWHR